MDRGRERGEDKGSLEIQFHERHRRSRSLSREGGGPPPSVAGGGARGGHAARVPFLVLICRPFVRRL